MTRLPAHVVGFVTNGPILRFEVDGPMQVECKVSLDRSAWLAARVADDPDNRNRILPRGLSVFAHTNPIYFFRDGAKVREEASIRYLEQYVRATLRWLETRPPFANPADRDDAMARARQALAAYQALLPGARR